jgi:hypothetical protein
MFRVFNVPSRPQITEQRDCITKSSRPVLQPATIPCRWILRQQVYLEAGHDPSHPIYISLSVIKTFSFTSKGMCYYITSGEAEGVSYLHTKYCLNSHTHVTSPCVAERLIRIQNVPGSIPRNTTATNYNHATNIYFLFTRCDFHCLCYSTFNGKRYNILSVLKDTKHMCKQD